jgi:hypothetical protein
MDQQDWLRNAERPTGQDDRRRKLFRLLGVLTMIGVATAAVVAVAPSLRSWLAGSTPQAYPTQSVPDGITVTTSESAGTIDPGDSFADTVAAQYPKGAAGITLPKASAVKGFTAKEVGTALQKVRAALIAGRLDNTMLVEHKPAKFLGMLAPRSRAYIATWFKTDDFSSLATWIAPSARLDPKQQPRVSGRVTYASKMVDQIQTLQVTTNFVWAYAFRGPDRPIAVVHDEIVWEFTDPDDVQPSDRGMWLGEAESYMAMMDCAAAEKGLLAPGHLEAADPQDTTDPDAFLRPDHTLDIGDDCVSPSPSGR